MRCSTMPLSCSTTASTTCELASASIDDSLSPLIRWHAPSPILGDGIPTRDICQLSRWVHADNELGRSSIVAGAFNASLHIVALTPVTHTPPWLRWQLVISWTRNISRCNAYSKLFAHRLPSPNSQDRQALPIATICF